MTRPDGVLRYRRIRAPVDDGARLLEPSLSSASLLLDGNVRARGAAGSYDVNGRSLGELTMAARRDLLTAAREYTAGDGLELGQLPPESTPLFLTGHQPELYHAGVWFKSFVAAQLARQHIGRAIHLLIDNDVVSHPTIRVPCGSVERPRVEAVGYDRSALPVPYEERAVIDKETFESFSERVQDVALPLGGEPLAAEMWKAAVAARRHRRRLGECIAAARRHVERRWGVENWELPFSLVCDQESFCWFLVHILDRLPDFHRVHNQSLLEYRRINGVRSQTHPVPELNAFDDWLEAPFWTWTGSNPQRRPLFVRRSGRALQLSDRKNDSWCIDLSQDGDAANAVAQILDSAGERKLRTRALTTTMYARLFLSDLFIHGIGSAKYDQLTDAIIERFFGFTAPAFLMATATAKLPISRPVVPCNRLPDIKQRIRRLTFHPDRFASATTESAALAAQKARWVEAQLPRGSRRRRHQEIVRLNAALQPFVEDQRQQLVEEQQQLAQLCRHERLLGSREFSFCLFPEKTLRPLLLDF